MGNLIDCTAMSTAGEIGHAEYTDAYRATKARVVGVLVALGDDDWKRTVPSCPDWTVHDLLAHMAGVPSELGAGRFPSADVDAWLTTIVESRRSTPVIALLDEWAAAVDAGEPLYMPNGLLLVDVVVHEQDLRGALGQPGGRDNAELTRALPLILASHADALRAAGLGAIEVRDGGSTWCSHDAPAGWTIDASPWEATRILESRRTGDELQAQFGGDALPYFAVLDAHLPLPVRALAE